MRDITDKQRLLSVLVGTDHEQWVADRRAEGLTWRAISLRLRDDYSFDCTQQWLQSHYGHAAA